MPSRDDFDDFFDDDDETSAADTRADGRLYRVPLGRLSRNLVNPRQEFGTEDDLIDFGKSLRRRQNQPCPCVSRSAYLKLWPEHASTIGDVDYVLVSGERRYRAATAVGMAALDCVVNDAFASDRKTFMEAVVSENVDRQNFDPIEEAYAVQALAAEFGSNRAVAQHFERADGWVTQRILLTNLAREVQDLVRKKAIPLESARSLGKLARDNEWGARDQLAWWEDEQARRAAVATARAAVRKAAGRPTELSPPGEVAASDPVESFTAVKQEPAQTVDDAAPEPTLPPEPTAPEVETVASPLPVTVPDPQPTAPPAEAVPEQRTDPTAAGGHGEQPRTLPYDDGPFLAAHLIRKMPVAQFDLMLDVLIEHRQKRAAGSA